MTTHPLALTADEYVAASGRHRDAARGEYRAFHRSGRIPDATCTVLPVTRVHEEGTTRRFLLRRADGLEIESVVLAQQGRTGRARRTLCVSSQIGCAMGCRFCATATLPRRANLDAGEIVAQWHAARHRLDCPIDNVVFMGMGEPTDNVDAVVQALRVLTDHDGPALAARRMTISTVGRAGGIHRLREMVRATGLGQVALAVSVNAPNDDVRSRLMPINRVDDMAALHDAMRDWCRMTRGRVLVEYVLIPDVNADGAHADELAAYLADLPCTVNVIPYNPIATAPWRSPSDAEVDVFVSRVRSAGLRVTRRRTMGRTVEAACGQLVARQAATPSRPARLTE